MENDYMKLDEIKNCDSCKKLIQPERLSEKTINGYMSVYKDCLSKSIPIETHKIFCGCDSLNTENKLKSVSETRRGFTACRKGRSQK